MATVEAAGPVAYVRPAGVWRVARRRLLRDKVGLVSASLLVLVSVASFAGGAIASKLLGHGPADL